MSINTDLVYCKILDVQMSLSNYGTSRCLINTCCKIRHASGNISRQANCYSNIFLHSFPSEFFLFHSSMFISCHFSFSLHFQCVPFTCVHFIVSIPTHPFSFSSSFPISFFNSFLFPVTCPLSFIFLPQFFSIPSHTFLSSFIHFIPLLISQPSIQQRCLRISSRRNNQHCFLTILCFLSTIC